MKRLGACIAIGALLTSGGCALLPEEEEHASSPVVHEYQQTPYTLTSVLRGDLEKTQSISCKYEPTNSETLSFGIGGIYYDAVYVNRGDYVTKGTLLASLQLGDLPEQIEQCEAEILTLNTRLSQQTALQKLQLKRYELYLDTLDIDSASRSSLLRQRREDMKLTLQSIEDSITIAQGKLDELNESLARRQIVAGMDGTINYIRSFKEGDRSVENSSFIKISDTDSSMFSASTEYYDFFSPGDFVEIVSNRTPYAAEYVSYEELGMDVPELDNKGRRTVYFRLLEPAVELESGDRGTLTITLETRTNVLYVDSKAVSSALGHYYVYYIDEQGMRRMREIEAGLQTNTSIEVLSGLSDGDEIILS